MSHRFDFRVQTLAIVGAIFTLVTMPLLAETSKGKKFALLVGVQEYDSKHLTPLTYAENDVNETATELKKAGYSVVLLTSSDAKNRPTLANIEKQLDVILKKATKHDLIFIGLAGHGLQFDKKEDSFFCPIDAKLTDVKTLLSMRSVYKKLEDSEIGVGLLLVDACRDDGGPRSARKRGIDGDKLPNPPKGVAALFSCSSGQFAWETAKYKHGVFFHHVLEGLRGKAKNKSGVVNWNSLSNYVSEQVSDVVPQLIGGGAKQEPHEMRSLAGKSPVLLEPGKGEIAKEPAKSLKARLVGTWTFAKRNQKIGLSEGTSMKVQFTESGKMTIVVTDKDMPVTMTGTYAVEGNQLTTVVKWPDDKEKVEIETIQELTESKLVTIEEKGGKMVSTEFQR